MSMPLDYPTVLEWMSQQHPDTINEIIAGLAQRWAVNVPEISSYISFKQPVPPTSSLFKFLREELSLSPICAHRILISYETTNVFLSANQYKELMLPGSLEKLKADLQRKFPTVVYYK
jgi:hypothetical protein